MAYLVGSDGSIAKEYAAALGLVGMFAVWLLAGLSLRSYASVAYANGNSFDLIAERLDRLQSRVSAQTHLGQPVTVAAHITALAMRAAAEIQGRDPESLPATGLGLATSDQPRRVTEESAIGSARGQVDAIEALMGVPDSVSASSAPKDRLDRSARWVLGIGYIDLWRRIHLAEEELILAPDAEPVAEAAEALERITDSGLKTTASLSYRLRVAVHVVDECASPYLRSLEAAATGPSDDEIKKAATDACAGTADARARGLGVIKEVRHTVNSFRDTRWEGLVHARNRLAKSTILVGAMGCAVLALAVILHVPANALIAAVVFYLVGGLVGLLARLRSDAEASTAVDDYGLSTVTLINTPLVSGLAAVAGVVLTSLLASSAVTAALVPPPSAGTATVVPAMPELAAIFALGPVGLLVAAIFGASPGLLLSRLQEQANRFKEDIARTERAGTTTA